MNTQKLYEARKRKGYSQEELAYRCGVSRQAVSKWEQGQSMPEVDKLLAISNALDISIDYLLDNEDKHEFRTKVSIDYEDLIAQEEKHDVIEYKSKIQFKGIPLIHIHRNRYYGYYGSRRRMKMRVAKGIIAIGDIAIGVISIGLVSCGLLSFGLLGFALLGIGVFQLGLYSFGIISIGFMATGVVALGIYAAGTLAIGYQSAVGVVAVGKYAIGVEAYGSLLSYKIPDTSSNVCLNHGSMMREIHEGFASQWAPFPIRWIVEKLLYCI